MCIFIYKNNQYDYVYVFVIIFHDLYHILDTLLYINFILSSLGWLNSFKHYYLSIHIDFCD